MREVQAIMALPHIDRNANDLDAWAFTKDGSYYVKITYMVGKSRILDLFHRAWVNMELAILTKGKTFFLESLFGFAAG